jgi:tripartite-type tricarboxylate transporter receptor subunit TctC
MGQIKSGQVKAIAASATKRSSALPELPTFAEVGYPTLAIDSWFAFFVSSVTPVAIRNEIHTELNKVLQDPAVIAQFESKGAAPMVTNLEQFQKIVDKDMVQWGQAVRDSGAKID